MASSIHGEMHMTFDVDIALHLERERAGLLFQALSRHYYVDRDSVLEAAASFRMFNAVHSATSTKIDFHVCPRTGIYAEEIRRGRLVPLVSNPEG